MDEKIKQTGQQRSPSDKTGGKVVPGSLASLDTTLPPTPLKNLLSAEGAGVYVYSYDHALIATVQEAGGEQYPVHVVTEWDELVSVIEIGVCHIVLLDADAFAGELAARIRELNMLESALVVLLAAPRDKAQAHVNLLSDRSIHRLLIKPAAVGITRLLFESAVGRYLQLREDTQMQLKDRIAAARNRPQPPAPRTQWPTWLLALSLVSLLVAALLIGGVLRFNPGGFDPSALIGNDTGAPDVSAPVVDAGPVVDTPVATVDGVAPADPGRASVSGPDTAGAGSPGSAAPDGAGSARDIAAGDQTAAAGNRADDTGDVPAADGDVATAGGGTAVPGGAQASAGNGTEASAPVDIESSPTPAAGEPGAGEPAPGGVAESFGAELARAENEAAAGRLFRPIGASALDIYAGILAAAPGHAAAEAGLAPIVEGLFADAEAALLAEDFDAAETALAHVERAQPDSGRLAFLRAQLAAARDRAPPPQPLGEFESLLVLAEARLAAGQLLEPAGNSAESYLTQAAALRPDDAAMLALRLDLAARAADEARLALERGDLETAATFADAAFRYGADDETLTLLEIDLTAAREQAALAAQTAELALARERIGQGRVWAPAGDSALDILAPLMATQPVLPGVERAWAEAISATVFAARSAVESGAWQDAEDLIDVLRRHGASDAQVAGIVDALAIARREQAYLSEAAPAAELTLLSGEPPTYPAAALRRDVEGWVDVEYVVGTDGRPGELRVVDAEPAGLFDEAALESVATHRYAPFELDGRTYARRLRIRIRFVLE